MLLDERAIIVTGAGGAGCGRAIARHFAADGARVVVADINVNGGEETVRLIRASGGQAEFRRADVCNESEVRELVLFAEKCFGPLAILVNNASAPFRPGDDMSYWIETAQTEFIGPILTTRYALDAMRVGAQGGAIVNVSSISAIWHGRLTSGGAPVYDAAKAGLLRLSTALAEMTSKYKIRINCFAPGWVDTEGPRQYWQSLSTEQRTERGVPQRLLSTDQVAGVVRRLATDEALTGRVVLWWSDDEAKIIDWGDRGYRTTTPFNVETLVR
jgi:NAD(P)-dependent dehydrogenase (short-subunit alcohol dehydrogenase family)